jgi:hypothetical protein
MILRFFRKTGQFVIPGLTRARSEASALSSFSDGCATGYRIKSGMTETCQTLFLNKDTAFQGNRNLTFYEIVNFEHLNFGFDCNLDAYYSEY